MQSESPQAPQATLAHLQGWGRLRLIRIMSGPRTSGDVYERNEGDPMKTSASVNSSDVLLTSRGPPVASQCTAAEVVLVRHRVGCGGHGWVAGRPPGLAAARPGWCMPAVLRAHHASMGAAPATGLVLIARHPHPPLFGVEAAAQRACNTINRLRGARFAPENVSSPRSAPGRGAQGDCGAGLDCSRHSICPAGSRMPRLVC